jgi:tripartite-type tricarboxylate transporter receptor subunit TctC
MNMTSQHRLKQAWAALGFATLVFALLPGMAQSQPYPNKPVRVIVTFPPGGTPDIYGRILSQELGTLWKQSVIVENKTGASGMIGTDFIAKSTPDGYNLLFAADASITIAPNLYAAPYNAIKDLTPIVNVASGPFVMLANSSFPANNVKELIALAKQQPGKISYASSGAGGQQHLSMEMVKSMADVNIAHIPYKGFGQGINDVMAGHVPLIFGGITASLQLVKGGKLKPIGITSASRSKSLPNVPAIAEILPGFESSAWFGLFGPAKLSSELTKRLSEASINAIQTSEVRRRIEAEGATPVGNSPQEFAKFLEIDISRWREVVKFSGAKPE